MIVDFQHIEESILPNFKGGEKSYAAKMFFDGKCRIMKGRLIPGASIGLHTHEGNCEIIFMRKGIGTVLFDGETLTLNEGEVHYCPMGHTHSLTNNTASDIEFDAVVAEQNL